VTSILVAAGVAAGGAGCRQLFGIEDTDVASGDAAPGVDGASDARIGPADAAADAATPDAAFVCPSGYVPLPGLPHRYRQLPQMPWATGRDACAAHAPGRTYMVILDDVTEQNAMMPFTPDLWVGITDEVQEGQWVTVRGTLATFLPWASGQPAAGTDQNCGELELDGLHDNTCGNDRTIVCECE
jgi:hypothetical protein